jgi:hypothetical protein
LAQIFGKGKYNFDSKLPGAPFNLLYSGSKTGKSEPFTIALAHSKPLKE